MTSTQISKGVNFLKTAGYFGRLFNMATVPNQAAFDKAPYTTLGMRTPASAAANLLGPAGALLGTPAEMIIRRNSLGAAGPDARQTLDETSKGLQNRGYLENAGKLALPSALVGGGLGLLGGLGLMAYNARNGNLNLDNRQELYGALGQAGAFAGIGAGAMGLGGGLTGLINKGVSEATSNEDKARANKMVGKHPYLTSLPFGSVVGAAFA